jgi:hypothetical protein
MQSSRKSGNARERYLGSKYYRDNLLPFLRWILDRHHQCDGITEIRILGGGRRGVWSGYFDRDHCDDLLRALLPMTQVRSKVPYDDYPRIGEANLYFTLQAVHPDLLGRAANRIKRADTTTADTDIVAYCLFAVDIDPVRKAAISATDEEKAHAWAAADKVIAWFAEHGIRCMVADSGNGYHLLIPTTPYTGPAVAVAARKANVLLKLLDAKFSTAQAKIDKDVFNPSRIFKLYGSLAMKGDHVQDRPYRWASIDMSDVPADVDVFAILSSAIEQFEEESRPTPTDPPAGQTVRMPGKRGWDADTSQRVLDEVLTREGLTYRRTERDGRTYFHFEACPVHADDDGHQYECCVLVGPSGKFGASCKHDSTVGWRAFKPVIGWDRHIGEIKRRLGLAAREAVDGGSGDDSAGAASDTTKARGQATVLIDLTQDVHLFHDGRGDTFVMVPVRDHEETYRIKSKAFRRWLAGLFWTQYHKAPNGEAVQNALATLESKALFEGSTELVAVRLAEYDGAIWLDLADERWRAVKVTQGGWEVVNSSPVRFLRPRGVLPLPEPVHGGNVATLKGLLNLGGEDDWVLVASWILGALRPKGPYPILAVSGEQGSAKSTLCRLVRAVVDPNVAPLRTVPREVRDLMIAASNSWVLAYDNLSDIPPWLSDALCRLATGGGFSTRELYTDDDEIIFDAMRPVLINGIEELATRSDLLDRTICLCLPTIPDGMRRTEQQLFADFEQRRPQILGAFLDAVAKALRQLPNVRLARPPRMADFGVWATAGESGLGLEPGAFLSAYSSNREDANGLALEACVLAPAIQDFITRRSVWEGTAQTLLDELEQADGSDKWKHRRDWPKSPQGLGKRLRRIAPNLRRIGIEVDFEKSTDKTRKRLIRLFNGHNQPSESSEREASDHKTG